MKRLLILMLFAFGLFSCGGYFYAEKYNLNISNEELVNRIKTFKEKYPQYNVLLLPDKYGEKMYNPDNCDSLFCSFYFYFSDINAAVHTVINVSKNANSNFPAIIKLTGVNYFESKTDIHVFRQWQEINKKGDIGNLTQEQNEAIKKKFETEILDHLGKWEH
jgi:hypothetical protein